MNGSKVPRGACKRVLEQGACACVVCGNYACKIQVTRLLCTRTPLPWLYAASSLAVCGKLPDCLAFPPTKGCCSSLAGRSTAACFRRHATCQCEASRFAAACFRRHAKACCRHSTAALCGRIEPQHPPCNSRSIKSGGARRNLPTAPALLQLHFCNCTLMGT